MGLWRRFIYAFCCLSTEKDTRKPRKHRITKKTRAQVWKKYFNNANVGKCFCCKKKVDRFNAGWHCSHVIPYANGGSDKVDNLRVCCAGCNLAMGSTNMNKFIKNKKAIKH